MESRHLAALACLYEPGTGTFLFSCEGRKASVRASADDIAKLFRLSHVKDEATEPASARGKTYAQMAQAVIDGTDKANYIWSSDVDSFFKGCVKLANKSKGITEGKMYILPRRQEGLMSPNCVMPQISMREAGGLPAIAKVAGVSTNARITGVMRQNTIYATVQAMGLPCKINAMHNVVAEVPDMQTAGAALQTIYQQFGVKGSFMVTWEGKGKLYWAPDTPVDRRQAVSYANQMGLPPPDARRYMERRRRYTEQNEFPTVDVLTIQELTRARIGATFLICDRFGDENCRTVLFRKVAKNRWTYSMDHLGMKLTDEEIFRDTRRGETLWNNWILLTKHL